MCLSFFFFLNPLCLCTPLPSRHSSPPFPPFPPFPHYICQHYAISLCPSHNKSTASSSSADCSSQWNFGFTPPKLSKGQYRWWKLYFNWFDIKKCWVWWSEVQIGWNGVKAYIYTYWKFETFFYAAVYPIPKLWSLSSCQSENILVAVGVKSHS